MNNTILLSNALDEIGVKEISGKQDNPEVIKYFEVTGHGSLHDETAWCSAFINYLAKKSGLEYTGKLNARSWLHVGEKIDSPQKGDIVIFWRESIQSWKGHVAIYIKEQNGYVYVLGGNQNNQVQISAYPKSRVLGYRRLNKLS